MASSSALHRPSLNVTAFATALAIHVLWLVLLTSVRAPPPLPAFSGDFPSAPYEVFVMPRAGSGPGATASRGVAGSQSSGLRRLGDGSRGAATAPPMAATAQPRIQMRSPPTVTPPRPSPALRPMQLPEARVVEASPAPVLAPRQNLRLAAPPTLTPAAPTPMLRPSQQPVVAPPEPPPPVLTPRQPLQFSAPPSLAQPAAPPQLRPSQGPAIAPPEPPPPVLAPRQTLQLAAPPAVTRAAPTPDLRPAQGLSVAPPVAESETALAGAPGLAQDRGGEPGGAASPGAGPAGAPPGGAGRPAGSPHPGCEVEVLMLLTPEERIRCRNQLDAFAERQAARNADDETARRLRQALGGPRIDLIDPEKRAYYDALDAARDAVRNGVGKNAGISCNLGALFGGAAGLTAPKVKIPGLPCSIVPPQGVLTEELRTSPP